MHNHADGTFHQLASVDLALRTTRDSIWAEQRHTLRPGDTLITFSAGLPDLLGHTDAFPANPGHRQGRRFLDTPPSEYRKSAVSHLRK